eukprot:373762-Rhodomonas_salina.9
MRSYPSALIRPATPRLSASEAHQHTRQLDLAQYGCSGWCRRKIRCESTRSRERRVGTVWRSRQRAGARVWEKIE